MSSKALTGQELRAFTRCSRFYKLGGRVEPNAQTRLLDMVFTTMSFEWLYGHRSPDLLWDLQKRAQRACTVLGLRANRSPEEIDGYVRKVLVDAQELHRYTAELQLDLLDSAFAYQAQVGPHVVELVVNALYKQVRSNHLHLLLFGPYAQAFDVQNDPMHLLYKSTFMRHLQTQTDVRRFTIHWIYTSPRDDLVRTSCTYDHVDARETQYVQGLLDLLGTGAGYPLVPCRYTSCQFRKNCFPF